MHRRLSLQAAAGSSCAPHGRPGQARPPALPGSKPPAAALPTASRPSRATHLLLWLQATLPTPSRGLRLSSGLSSGGGLLRISKGSWQITKRERLSACGAAAPAARGSSTSWYTTAVEGAWSSAGWVASSAGCQVSAPSTRATCVGGAAGPGGTWRSQLLRQASGTGVAGRGRQQ
jgi:hypothetical protein